MSMLLYRLLVLLWFLFYMASIYLFLHIVMARFLRDPDSRVLWFFGVITGPLTRPIRACLPSGTPEGRVRLIALGVYVVLWLGFRVAVDQVGGVRLD